MCLKTMEKIDEAKLPSFIFSMGFKHMLASFLADSGSNATVLSVFAPPTISDQHGISSGAASPRYLPVPSHGFPSIPISSPQLERGQK